ncbi:MAG: hypothetical protein DRP01_00915 [Archaeoglobales archaeon]|nr:MAG: hypothetical protein DRP01_00915 [Archaeoglobales archaeon]
MRVKKLPTCSKTDKAEFSSDYINAIKQLPYELLTKEEKCVIRRLERESLAYERFLRRMGIAYKGQLTPTEVKILRRARKRDLEHQKVVDEIRRSRLEPTPQQLHKVPTQREKPMFFFRLWPTGESCSYERFMREYWPAIKKRYEKLEAEQRKRKRRSRRVRENAYADFKKRLLGGGQTD